VPQMSIVGSHFPLTNQVAVLDNADSATPAPVAGPTYVVIATTDAHQAPDVASPVIIPLAVGMQLTLIRTQGDWSRVFLRPDSDRICFEEYVSAAPVDRRSFEPGVTQSAFPGDGTYRWSRTCVSTLVSLAGESTTPGTGSLLCRVDQ